MNILLLVLDKIAQSKALEYINNLYPDGKVDLLLKEELATKPFSEKVESFRGQNYDLAIVFSENLQYQTKVKILKGILLFARAEKKKIVDDKGEEIEVNTGDFIFICVPALLGEFIFAIAGVVFSFVFLNLFFLFLKAKKKQPRYDDKGDYFAFDQSTFAFSDVEGGDAGYRLELADGFAASGEEISFLTSCSSQFKGTKSEVFLIKPGRMFDSFYDIQKLMYNYRFIWQAFRLFSQNKPVALIQYHDPFDFSGAFLATIFKIPLIIDVHNVNFLELSYWYKHHLSYFVKLAEDICMTRADLILAISEELRDIIKGLAPEGKHIVVKPNGVNVDLFKPLGKGKEIREKYGIKAEVVVGYAGSFDITHGLDVFTEAIEILSEKNDKIHFLFVGRGAKYSEIKSFVEQKKLGSKVSLVGDVPHYEIPVYLDACDILIALYTHPDFFNSPIKILEYMAMEKAVVATSQGQITKIIDNQEQGVLIDLKDKNSLAEAITLLADNKDMRIKMGKKARKKVMENYTWKMTAEKVIKAYREIIAVPD
jgi:glycosyltransferase involved in cell wall biosynthesis